MNLLSIFFIAIALTFDTFAVSVSSGMADIKIKFWQAAKIAIIFAVFQATMPLIGWYIGDKISFYLSSINNYIAFFFLFLIGIRMIYEAFKQKETRIFNPHSYRIIFFFAFITSIDALFVGFSLAFVAFKILITIMIIGFLTFLVAMIGMLLGKNAGKILGNKSEIIGGIILIIIAIKILLQNFN